MEKLQSSVGKYMHQRLRKWAAVSGQHICSVRATVYQRQALTVKRTFDGTHPSIPKISLNQASFQSRSGKPYEITHA
jgi:hypothetical protein